MTLRIPSMPAVGGGGGSGGGGSCGRAGCCPCCGRAAFCCGCCDACCDGPTAGLLLADASGSASPFGPASLSCSSPPPPGSASAPEFGGPSVPRLRPPLA